MTVTFVLNNDEYQAYLAREEQNERIYENYQSLLEKYNEMQSRLERMKTYLQSECKGNEYLFIYPSKLLEAMGLDVTEYIGEWRNE